MLSRVIPWLRAHVLRRRLEREMQEEMAEHLERATARLRARGLSEGDARRQAEREFGNVPWLQDQARDARGTVWLDALVADVRYALRQYARRPGTTMTMFLVLALGMSLSTLVFSYVHSYATLPPPLVERDGDLVRIRGSRAASAGRLYRHFSEEEFSAYRSLHHFRAVAGWTNAPVALDVGRDEGSGIDARAAFVTGNYFSVLGVRPALGPGLPETSLSSDPPVAVISHRTWVDFFGRDASVIGTTVLLNGHPVTVAGVAPNGFVGVGGFAPYLLWLPQESRASLFRDPPSAFLAIARMRPGVSLAAASAAVEVIGSRSAESLAEAGVLEPSTDVVPLLAANGDPMFDQDVRLMWMTLGLLALLILIVTCTNVSALLTGLATARRQEIAVRLSLGAARGRLIRQLLTESAFLACVAAAGAIAIVGLVLDGATRHLPALPLELGLSWPATVFTFAVAIGAGVLFGLSPALHATRLAIGSALRDSNTLNVARRARLQRGLVVTQIAFTQPLIVLLAAVLLIALGVRTPPRSDGLAERLVDVSVRIPTSIASVDSELETRQRIRHTMEEMREKIAALPGTDVVIPHWPRLSVLGDYAGVEDSGAAPLTLMYAPTVEAHFEALGIPVLRGRVFNREDALTAARGPQRNVVISAGYARRLWGDADPLGRQIAPASDTTSGLPVLTVIGVVDFPRAEPRDPREGYWVFLPADTAEVTTSLLVRTSGVAAPLLAEIRQSARSVAPDMVVDARTVAQRDAEHMRRFRIVTGGILSAGLIALLLSAIGLYAVIALAVGQRTREIAIRLAVGGGVRRIVGAFVVDGLRLGLIGLALGLPASIVGLHLITRLPDMPYVNLPPVAIIAAGGVLAVTLAAAWLPARRAARVEPAITLRNE